MKLSTNGRVRQIVVALTAGVIGAGLAVTGVQAAAPTSAPAPALKTNAITQVSNLASDLTTRAYVGNLPPGESRIQVALPRAGGYITPNVICAQGSKVAAVKLERFQLAGRSTAAVKTLPNTFKAASNGGYSSSFTTLQDGRTTVLRLKAPANQVASIAHYRVNCESLAKDVPQLQDDLRTVRNSQTGAADYLFNVTQQHTTELGTLRRELGTLDGVQRNVEMLFANDARAASRLAVLEAAAGVKEETAHSMEDPEVTPTEVSADAVIPAGETATFAATCGPDARAVGGFAEVDDDNPEAWNAVAWKTPSGKPGDSGAWSWTANNTSETPVTVIGTVLCETA